MAFGLEEKTIKSIHAVFENVPEVEEVILYGSRAKGNYKPASDIDLVLKGESLSRYTLNKINTQIDDLLLPYSFDIAVLHDIHHPDLLDHIHRAGIIFYSREKIGI